MRDLVFFIPSIENGGVEKNLFLLLRYLSKKNNKIHLITASTDFKKAKLNKNINIIKPASPYWNNKGRIFKYLICSIILIKFFFKKKIVIFSFQANVFAILISLIIKAKIIIRLNTSTDKYMHNFLQKKMYKFFYSFADLIIVNSLSFKKIIKQELNLISKCIYNPINSKNIIKKKINFFNKFKGLRILSIGRLTDQKDQITILKSAKILRDQGIRFKIYIIGRGYRYKRLLEYVVRNKLTKYVKLAGYKPDAQNYLTSADLFILSSKYEGLPNVLIEAQNSNIPIISSKCNTGPGEILLNGKLGELFKVGDYYSLYLKIKDFEKNNKSLKNKSNLAKKHLYRFDHDINLRKYFQVIKKLINE
jgi:glycosyltransferase involved in cell wall biosynthesis